MRFPAAFAAPSGRLPAISLTASLVSPDGTILAIVYAIPQLGSLPTSPTSMNRALFIAMDGPQLVRLARDDDAVA